MTTTGSRPRLLTGDRPTGPLHLGHLVGSLQNRVRLQERYECFFIIADLHMLTTKNSPEDIAKADANARGLVLDALSTGIDPANATFYLQSAVPEIHELAGLLQSQVSVGRVERLPALKDMARAANIEMSLALLNYPVLQSADILCVRANAVPVGKDNYAYVEITREIARRINRVYGEVFPIPEIIEGSVPTLIGTDGQAKMSKSLGNAIALGDDAATVRRKVMRMYTDPNRIRPDIPGRVEGNPVFACLDAFGTDTPIIDDLKQRYRAGTVGDVEVKEYLVEVLDRVYAPMRERRERFSAPGFVDTLIVEGTERVREETRQTVRDLKRAMGLAGVWNRIRRTANRHA
ncbi:MAG TPA: tryptophan--tRNA ligase [Thermomicrobiales bacterium]|nr:tryptophan--tRNA ligase [Thermomicrobiales bacterium]